MTQKKLEIIGPYTPEHPGPFCTRDGRAVKVLCRDSVRDKPIIGLVCSDGYDDFIVELTETGRYRGKDLDDSRYDLMNAREVPMAREFWVVGGLIFQDEKEARRIHANSMHGLELIHVREVLPGEE